MTIKNGAYLNHCEMKLFGNFHTSASMTPPWAVLTITGQDAGRLKWSSLLRSHLQITVELNGNDLNSPQTINFGTAGSGNNVIQGCEGILSFLSFPGSGRWAASNVDATNSQVFQFSGVVIGDANLHPAGAFGTPGNHATGFVAGSPVLYAANHLSGSSGQIYDAYGDFFACTLSANITIGLPGSPSGCIPGPQRKTFIITQANPTGGRR